MEGILLLQENQMILKKSKKVLQDNIYQKNKY